MTKINKNKGQIILGAPTVPINSKEAKNVSFGETVRKVYPKKIGDIVIIDKKPFRVIGVHPIEYKSKYGKEWIPAQKKMAQTYNVWTGDYRYTYQEVVYDPNWKFNVGEVVSTHTNEFGIIESRHGTICPWYKVMCKEDRVCSLYETALSHLSSEQKSNLLK